MRGVFASVFCDFGPAFTVYDVDGEEAHSGIVASVTPGNPTLVASVEDDRLEFIDGAGRKGGQGGAGGRREGVGGGPEEEEEGEGAAGPLKHRRPWKRCGCPLQLKPSTPTPQPLNPLNPSLPAPAAQASW